jgi:hypothetical protein
MRTILTLLLVVVAIGAIAQTPRLTGGGVSLDTNAVFDIGGELAGFLQMDDKLAAKAEVVLRAHLLSVDGDGKNARFRVQVLQVLKNELGLKIGIGDELSVDVYTSKDGLPMGGKFTAYLERYNKTNTKLWKVVGAGHNTK